jgi:hypothetical protein
MCKEHNVLTARRYETTRSHPTRTGDPSGRKCAAPSPLDSDVDQTYSTDPHAPHKSANDRKLTPSSRASLIANTSSALQKNPAPAAIELQTSGRLHACTPQAQHPEENPQFAVFSAKNLGI